MALSLPSSSPFSPFVPVVISIASISRRDFRHDSLSRNFRVKSGKKKIPRDLIITKIFVGPLTTFLRPFFFLSLSLSLSLCFSTILRFNPFVRAERRKGTTNACE